MPWLTLKNRRQFDLVYSHGLKRVAPALVLFHLREASDQQVAYVASRKVGGAVQRNRAKRLMRVAFRQLADAQPMPHGWFVLIARSEILGLGSGAVQEQLHELLANPDSTPGGDGARDT